MKTGTLTFHAPNNNGSFLQAYALQTVLRTELGVENEIINFYSEQQESQYAVFRNPKSAGDIVRNCISLLHYGAFKQKFNRFEKMRETHLQMTPRYKTEKEVYAALSKYDALICGSDQIWNTGARDFSNVYFLPGVTQKKIGYAISAGSNLAAMNKEKIAEAAKQFDFLSVREKSMQDYLCGLGVSNCKLVLDPTMLMQKDQYENLIDKETIVKGKYIFLYTINFDSQVLETVRKLSEKYKIPVYTAFTGYSGTKCYKYGIKILYDVGPAQFLSLIRNATIVCSNSFHGIAFSIIFQKAFYRLCNISPDGEKKIDDRIDGILGRLGLTERNIDRMCVSSLKKKTIDYVAVEERLQKLRGESMEYLKRSL